jgi:hypothetical protein
MAMLSPALLCFASEMRSLIPIYLKGERTDLAGPVSGFFLTAVELMETEIELRLQAAVSEIEGNFPRNGYRELLRQAPRDILKMFNES